MNFFLKVILVILVVVPNTQQQQQQQQLSPYNNNNNAHHDSQSSNPFIMATHKLLLDLRQQMITRSLKFDDHFKSLLQQSKLSLHNMFIETYGLMYEKNTEIFTNMYESLEQYYATGQTRLTKSMENFFEQLYQKIFQVYNSNKAFSASYLACATEQLAHLKPFKDAPDKLIEEIRHAFVAARTFNQALNSGIDVIKTIISLGQPPTCVSLINDKLLLRMHGGLGPMIGLGELALSRTAAVARKPCLGYCEEVIIRCVGRSNWEQLSDKWKTYVLSLGELAKKLSVNYNIETIIAPLDVQISEAIMNFQENAQNITQQVFQVCGRATPNNAGIFGVGTNNNEHQSSGAQLSPIKPMQQQQHRIGKRWAPAPALAVVLNNPRRPQAAHSTLSESALADYHHHHRQQYSPTMDHDYSSSASSSFDPSGRQPGNSKPSTRGGHYASGSLQRQPVNFGAAVHPRPSPATSSVYQQEIESLTQPMGKRSPVIIDEIKDYMLSTKSFWSNLPNAVCTSNQTLGLNATNNNAGGGGAQSRRQQQQYSSASATTTTTGNQCFTEALKVSDMNTDVRYMMEIDIQVRKLDSMHSRIISALNGQEIDWNASLDHVQKQPLTPMRPSPPPPPVSLQPISSNKLNAFSGPNNSSSSVSSMGRHPAVTITSTTSTLAPAQSDDESSDDELLGEDDPGSGDSPSTKDPDSNNGDEPDDPIDVDDESLGGSTTEVPDDIDDPTDDDADNANNNNSDPINPTTTEQVTNNNGQQTQQTTDDLAEKPNNVILDLPNDIITPPDAQKSNAGSATRFVIIDEIRLLFVFLNIVIISLLLLPYGEMEPLLRRI